MHKPDFKELKRRISLIEGTDTAFRSMFAEQQQQEEKIRAACRKIVSKQAKAGLYDIPVDKLKDAKAGIRVQVLTDAGFKNLGEIAAAGDFRLRQLEGIGEKQLEAIKSLITEFANSLSARLSVRLDESQQELLTELLRYMKCERIRKDALADAGTLSSFTEKIRNSGMILDGFRWLFSGSAAKTNTLALSMDIYEFSDSALFDRLLKLLTAYRSAQNTDASEATETFRKNGADFYALLEKLGSVSGHRAFIYDSIPQRLAEEISSFPLTLSYFRGNLRAYQEFGARYILRQKRVLLGDEMGLGKTIQAIAAMAQVLESDGEELSVPYFLIICPASVIVNWARELEKFSRIESFILHGPTLEDAFAAWQESGGAAVTNYESMAKITDRIDNNMTLKMLVIDEAHYIKNPDAKRTQLIRRLDNESERILMMTGTPLENRVEEMCNLIDFIRPDMTKEIRGMAHVSHIPEFREALAPFYLRRTREQVLEELPPIEEVQEWCELTAEDKKAYAAAVVKKNFADMRRVSFLSEVPEDTENTAPAVTADASASSKAKRLLELCDQARDEGRKLVIFSFFRNTLSIVESLLGERCKGVISGDTRVESRQSIVDEFADSEEGSALLCQIVAGGVGLNIQAASIVIFCEPQIKPSLTTQALSRVYRMGQTRNVLVYHLLCPHTVDERMVRLLEEKQAEFDNYADESVVAGAFDNIMDKAWIEEMIDEELGLYS
ncbi:MAG: DEAD/DEAH box helicase [Lachnospiraceae bacterium]|nr:DEAD/DEAH box helicase [Lachnospiraceae bacterium]